MAHKYNKREFVEKACVIHNNKYSYNKCEYHGGKVNVKITCPIHGDFEMTPLKHLHGKGCPECTKMLTDIKKKKNPIALIEEDEREKVIRDNRKPAMVIKEYLEQFYDGDIILDAFDVINDDLELDIYIPELKFAIEFNGLRYHCELYRDKDYHLDKLNKCLEKGIKLIQIFEDEWIFDQQLVLNKLLHILHLAYNKEKIMGRNTIVKEIDFQDAESFLGKYHIQKGCVSTISLGCFYDNKLIGVMSFLNNNDKWELTRFATDYNFRCQGVISKLFNYFVKKYKPLEIKTYADRRWVTDIENNTLTMLGFKLKKILEPDYRFYCPIMSRKKRISKFNFRRNKLHKKYGLPLYMSEESMCEELNAYKIWDCGTVNYIWKQNKKER